MSGTSLSKELATCMGIDDVWDFSQHTIDLTKVDHHKLEYELCQRDSTDSHWRSYQKFRVLAANGFTFYFIPNG